MINNEKKLKVNRKRLYAQILIVVLAVSIFIFTKLLPDINLNAGKNAYQNKKYQEAYYDLQKAVRLSPRNYEARYYYIQTLIKLKPTIEIQKEIYNITQNNLADSADLFADMQMGKWKKQILGSSGENYINEVPLENDIVRWDVKKFPLNVYIKTNSTIAPKYYEGMIQKAFLQWQTSTDNFIRFKFVDNEKDSNITVSINSSADMKKCTGADCKYAVAYTTPQISGNHLKKMNIYFYDSNNLGQPFPEREIYNTALHEIGHSLGIMGHSQNPDDLMYMESNKNNINYDINSDIQLISSSDLNTLNLLYKLVPDITNTSMSKFDTSRQFYSPIVMGSSPEINSKKITVAQNYIKAAPQVPNGYIDLAAAYSETKQYKLAIETLEKGLSYCSNNNEKFIIYYNTAITYMQLKDWNDAIKYGQMAKSLNTDSDVDGLIATAYLNSGKKELAEKMYLEAIAKSPDDIITSYNLATLYLREFNFIQAGKVLNKLVKANPDAKDDPRIKRYGLWMFLFR